MKDLHRSVVLALLIAGAAGSNQALGGEPRVTDAHTACRTMMEKLALEYDIEQMSGSKGVIARFGLADGAEAIALRGYGWSRTEIEENWPGLLHFATMLIVEGVRNKTAVRTFRDDAIVACWKRFD